MKELNWLILVDIIDIICINKLFHGWLTRAFTVLAQSTPSKVIVIDALLLNQPQLPHKVCNYSQLQTYVGHLVVGLSV
jgi:hypothetical protein